MLPHVEEEAGLEPSLGERAALALVTELEGNPIIISDDTPFLRWMDSQGVLNATPAALIVNMVERDIISNQAAARHLQALRPYTRSSTVDQALQDLEQLSK
jgi:hypothetical protein